MKSADRKQPAAIRAAAADWMVRHDAGLSESEEREFARWIESDERHGAAWAEMRETWSFVSRPAEFGAEAEVLAQISELARARSRRRRWILQTVGLAALLVLGFGWWNQREPAATLEAGVGITARPERHELPDGSFYEAGPGAMIAADYTAAERTIRLSHGTAYFEVAKDAGRPFVVYTGRMAVRAVGTAFVVRHAPEDTAVLVTEGVVRVQPEGGNTRATDIAAGNRARLAEKSEDGRGEVSVVAVDADEMRRELAWRGNRMEFDAVPLRHVVELFNRRNTTTLLLSDAGTGALQVSGTYWIDNPDGFAQLAAAALGLELDRSTPGVIRLGR